MMRLARRLLSKPKISIIVVIYDMAREAPRTLRSLAKGYQSGLSEDEYEVIVVDNGSPNPLGESRVKSFGRQFRYYFIEDASPSPAAAINFGVQHSRAKILNIMIDGARIVTPGLLRYTLLAFRTFDDPMVVTLGWHLGPDRQQRSVQKGYNKSVEDELLDSINWPHNGYGLYKIASLGGSSRDGCFSTISESNTIGISRKAFDQLDGFDTAFALPGGGLLNLDFYKRASERQGTKVVCLLGEGSFHQLHGGASTGLTQEKLDAKFREWSEDYKRIRGVPWSPPKSPSDFLGAINREVLPHLAWSANHRIEMLAAVAAKETTHVPKGNPG